MGISKEVNPYIKLAKKAVENYIEKGKVIEVPDDLPKEMLEKKSGTFVTIKKKVRGLSRSEPKVVLRGCIGTYLPTRKNVAEEVIHNAIAAATEDYRFGPIQKEELPYLSYEVYVLEKPEIVTDIKEPTKFSEEKFRRAGLDPKKYGILVKTFSFPSKSALLLPDLPGIDTVKKQILLTCQKGGINPQKEKIIIYKFWAKKYGK